MSRSGIPVVAAAGGFEDGEGVGGVDVRHAVRHQHDVVERVGAFAAGLVGEPDAEVEAGLHVGRTVRRQLRDRPLHVAVVRSQRPDGVLVDNVCGEVHHGDAVVAAQASPDALGGLAGDGHAVAVPHRPRGVEHEGHVDRPVISAQIRRLEGQAREALPAVQGMPEDVGGDGEAVR